MDDAPESASPADIERRAIWLAVAAALVMVFRGGGAGFFNYLGAPKHVDRQLWLFILSTASLGLSVLLAGLVALPEYIAYPARVATRWNPVRLYGWALLLFIVGVLITAIAGIWVAADTLGESPFS